MEELVRFSTFLHFCRWNSSNGQLVTSQTCSGTRIVSAPLAFSNLAGSRGLKATEHTTAVSGVGYQRR